MTLLGPAGIRDLAEQLKLQPTKKLGQNFQCFGSSPYWIKANLNKPLDDVDWRTAPADLDINQGPIWYAQLVGKTKQITIKEINYAGDSY